MSAARKRALAGALAVLVAAVAGAILLVGRGGGASNASAQSGSPPSVNGAPRNGAGANGTFGKLRQCLQQNGVTPPAQGQRPDFNSSAMQKALQVCRQYLPSGGQGGPPSGRFGPPGSGPNGAPPSQSPSGTTTAASAAPRARVYDVISSTSSNWAGYAVTSTDPATPAAYTSVSGTWKQPAATCSSTAASSYSAFWVGLGGFADSSQALEQIGTEANCSGAAATYDVWYELVPAPSVPVKLIVHAGDTLTASVTVAGQSVTVSLRDVTRKTVFTKKLTMSAPDVSSAEWIAEAPSACSSGGTCRTLPLANFGTVAFSAAKASAAGHTGTVSDPAWSASAVSLAGSNGFFGRFGTLASGGNATPSALSADGSSFNVAWAQAAAVPPAPPGQLAP